MKKKRCFKCGKEKNLNEFYPHKQMTDGHLGKCIECTKKDNKLHRESNPLPIYETRLRIHKKNPTHYNANKVIEAALIAGEITKLSYCQGCGRTEDEVVIHAHHNNYQNPLDVIWVCPTCHRRLDRIRSAVEKGISVKEFKAMRNRNHALVRRALMFYQNSGKLRSKINIKEVMRQIQF